MNMDVSIIVPVYNMEKYIVRCLHSLLNQITNCHYEVIVIDDGSVDQSVALIKQHFGNNPKLRLITQSNQGVSKARFSGIEASVGTYLAFVDSDDYVELDYVEKLYQAALINQADIVCCDYYNEFSHTKFKSMLKLKAQVLSNYEGLHHVLHDFKMRSYLWNKLYKKSLFAKIEIVHLKYFEDLSIMPQLFYYANQIVVIKDCLYHYVQRNGSAMHGNSELKLEHYVEALKVIKNFLQDQQIITEFATDYNFLCDKVILSLFIMLPKGKTIDKLKILRKYYQQINELKKGVK